MKIEVAITVCRALLVSFSLLCSSLALAADKKKADPELKVLKQQPAVSATQAVIILPLGQSRDTRLFFSLANNSPKSLTLTSVKSTQISSVEWVPAQTTADSINPWTIPAHQSLVLDGKVRYLQLRGLRQAVSTGDELEFELGFSDGSKLLLMAKARSAYDQIHGH